MKGRKPKPLNLRVLEGNRGQRRIPEVPSVEVASAEPPEKLDPEAQKFWDATAPYLIQLELLTRLNARLYSDACSLWSIYRNAKSGWKRKVKCYELATRMFRDFAMTPAEAARLS